MIYKLKNNRVWRSYTGGTHLDLIYGPAGECDTRNFPEEWIGSCTVAFNPGRDIKDEGVSLTEDGRLLTELVPDKDISFLLKLLDSSERLVIQVHPTVDFAKKHFNSKYGKEECWYSLEDSGYVYIGFKEGITKDKWIDLFNRQDIDGMLECLHKFDIKKSDLIFVYGGVPHAIGADCFIAELQEPTDLMVIPERVTPSGRKLADEKLHCGLGFDKMFDCFIYEGLSREETISKYFIKSSIVDECCKKLIDENTTTKFEMFELDVNGSYVFPTDNKYMCAIILDGDGAINGTDVSINDRIFVDKDSSEFKIEGNIKFILCR